MPRPRDPDSEAEDRAEELVKSLDEAIRKELKHGDLDEALGKFVREQCGFGCDPAVHDVYDDFVEAEIERRLEDAIPCPEEEA